MVRIREIFTSIQGEGPFVGYKQLFIRFCSCNLNCIYCDTDFNIQKSVDYTLDEVYNICIQNTDCHSVSLTGGEPLLDTQFISQLSRKINGKLPIYLETNGTLYKELEEVIAFISYISADIKLPSATGIKPLWEEHDKFFAIASGKVLFAKAVFDKNITQDEIQSMIELCKKYKIELILQPMMIGGVPSVDSDFMLEVLDNCISVYKNVRLIPQVHKFINVI